MPYKSLLKRKDQRYVSKENSRHRFKINLKNVFNRLSAVKSDNNLTANQEKLLKAASIDFEKRKDNFFNTRRENYMSDSSDEDGYYLTNKNDGNLQIYLGSRVRSLINYEESDLSDKPSDEDMSESSYGDYNNETTKINLYNSNVLDSFDRAGVSNHSATMILASFAHASGCDLSSTVCSVKSTRSARAKNRSSSFDTIHKSSIPCQVVHWDGKLMKDKENDVTFDQLRIYTTEGKKEQL